MAEKNAKMQTLQNRIYPNRLLTSLHVRRIDTHCDEARRQYQINPRDDRVTSVLSILANMESSQ